MAPSPPAAPARSRPSGGSESDIRLHGRPNDTRVIKIDRAALRLQAIEEEAHAAELRRKLANTSFWGNQLQWTGLPGQSSAASGGQGSPSPQLHRHRRSRTTSNDEREETQFASNVVTSAKYSVWNFAPRVLLAQVKRPSNMYFLFIAVLQTIKEVSNTNGVPTILLPLTIVFICSMIKEALEDRERHRADTIMNSRTVLALSKMGEWEFRKWGDVCVGDIVKVLDGETIPADLFVLSTEEQDSGFSGDDEESKAEEDQAAVPPMSARSSGNLAYIETKSLDGETNLKIRSAIPVVSAVSQSLDHLLTLRGVVECEPPNNRINSFEGKFSLFVQQDEAQLLGLLSDSASKSDSILGEHPVHQMVTRADESISLQFPITAKQMILRSCVLRNTRSVTGLVTFTGHETKVFCSNTEPVVKSSSVEGRLNGLIIGVVLIQQLVCALGALLGALWMITNGDPHWYLDSHVHTSVKWNQGLSFPYEELFKLHLRYFIIMQNFVPISLNVSLEFVKYWQAYFMEQDLEMYDEASDTPAMVRSSALNEDLGRVHHIFTDKTGTLTMNLMLFRYCMIGGKHYGGDVRLEELEAVYGDGGSEARFVDFDPTVLFADLHAGGLQANKIQLFLRHLALCHTLIPAKSFAEMCAAPVPEYSASSPDEQALVSAAAFCNVRFVHRTPTTMTLLESGDEGSTSVYKVQNVLEFDSDRKRMTIIVETPDGAIELFCKGADNVIFERLAISDGQSAMVDRVYDQLSTYAKGGMRTLCLAHKRIDPATYNEWNQRYQVASSSMEELVKRRLGLANAIDPLMNEIEQDLQLLGVTGVQDKLQVGVPKTLELLQQTNIKVWTLTGDKMETAVNIGYACSLLSNSMTVKQLSCDNYVSTLKSLQEIITWHTQANALSRERGAGPSTRSTRMKNRRARRKGASPKLSFFETIAQWFSGSSPSSKVKGARTRRGSKGRGQRSGQYSPVAVVYDSDLDAGVDAADEHGALLGSSAPLESGMDDLVGFATKASRSPELALVIDGSTLEFALRPRLRPLFYNVTKVCKSVICCRVSPKQKSDVVEMIRQLEPESITLAIGDGANDVGMIQAAHVGVGISGQEGTQAVNASDYAIAQFRFLQRLLFVHGRWAYRRVAKLMSYMLYKNVTYVLTTFWFGCFCGFSGQPLIIDVAAQSFNVLYTSLPLVLFAVFDQDVSSESASQFPYLYSLGQRNVLLRRQVFWPWIFNGVWHSIVIFFISSWAFEGFSSNPIVMSHDGKSDSLVTLGLVVFTNLVIIVNLKLCLETFLVTWYFFVTVSASIALWFVVGNLIAAPHSRIVHARGEMTYLQHIPSFWFSCVLVLVLSLIRDVIWKTLRRLTFPSTYHILQEREKLSLRNSPRSLLRDYRRQEVNWETDVQAITAAPNIVDYAKLFRQIPAFEDDRDSFQRSSPLAVSLMESGSPTAAVGTGVRARGSFHHTEASSWFDGSQTLGILAAIGTSTVANTQYHGYAFSEDENVDSDVEAASSKPISPRTRLARKSSLSFGIGGDSTSQSVGQGITAGVSPLRGKRAIKKIFKSVRGEKNA